MNNEIRIAVVGNPNTGKSALINALAGSRLQVGNWPGTTVERKEVILEWRNYKMVFVDLPGTYSLTPFSLEEKITRDFLFTEKPDIVLCVVDSTSLERNLYFVLQLMELEMPLVLALNMFDEATKMGYKFDIKKMESILGVRAVPTVATRGEGVSKLKEAIIEVFESKRKPNCIRYGEDFETVLQKVKEHILSHNPHLRDSHISRAVLIKVLERDNELLAKLNLRYHFQDIKGHLAHIEKVHEEDIEGFLADIRYGFVKGITRQVSHKPTTRKISALERLDRIFLNRYIGIPMFLVAMWMTFKITFDVAKPYVEFLDETINGVLANWISFGLVQLGTPNWLISLVIDGILGGVGIIFSFVPVIGVMMFVVTFLESSGYVARIAFLTDRLTRLFGVQGKSFIPMIMGFGCNVPSVYATRILEHQERLICAFIIPCMSCGARLPVYAAFVGAFFDRSAGTVLFSIYLLGVVVGIIIGMVAHRIFYRGVRSVFIMELPPYRLPTFRDLKVHTWMKLRHFIVKAGTWILLVNVLIWVLLNVPLSSRKPEDSVLGRVGKAIAPVFAPLGFGDWSAAASLISGTLAKELVVSTMVQIYGGGSSKEENRWREKAKDVSIGRDVIAVLENFLDKTGEVFGNLFSTFGVETFTIETSDETKGIIHKLRERFSRLSAFSFMVFVLLYWPCFVYGAAIRAEFGSMKLYGKILLVHTIIAWVVAFLVYQGGRLLGF